MIALVYTPKNFQTLQHKVFNNISIFNKKMIISYYYKIKFILYMKKIMLAVLLVTMFVLSGTSAVLADAWPDSSTETESGK